MKKTTLLTLTTLTLLTGCVIQIPGDQTPQEPLTVPVATQTNSTLKTSSYNKDSCDVMYTTYKQCYGLGIQLNSTDMCITSGAELANSISTRWGSAELGTALGSICAVACESANQNMAMPSYNDFSQKACN